MTQKEPKNEQRKLHEVTLTFDTDPGCEVFVVGSFNDWDDQKTPMTAGKAAEGKAGEYTVTLELPAGEYEYKFVCNGRWQADPNATAWSPNPFGSLNSRVTVNG